jgi:VanZ family protein
MKPAASESPVAPAAGRKTDGRGARAVLLGLLAAWLLGLGWLTLRQTRTLFEVRDDVLVSRTEDWSLFLLDRGAAWDGRGVLRLRGRMRIVDEDASIGLTVVLAGGPGREESVLFSNQRPDREFRVRTHGTDPGLAALTPPRPLAAIPGVFHDCVVEASIGGGLLRVDALVDGTAVGTWTCAAAGYDPPLRFGLWGARIGVREFAGFRAEQLIPGAPPIVLSDLRFDRADAASRIHARVAWSLAPFSLDHVPFVSSRARRSSVFAQDLLDVVGNVIMFLPAGFLLIRLLRWRVLAIVLLCAALSLVIECLQLLVPTRVTSVFDLAANAVGAWLGAAASSWLARRRTARRPGPTSAGSA